jgi:short-subunit dehydrogenase
MSMNPPLPDLNQLRIWVVGASSGIGRACAAEFLRSGARVALSARRIDNLQDLAQQALVQWPHSQTLILPLDVTDAQALDAAVAELERQWGGIDLLLHVSGIYIPVRAQELTAAVAKQTLLTNVLGPMQTVAAVLPGMLQRHSGHIAIVGSVAGYSGLPKALVYGPSKAALINFCETLYYDLHPQGLAVHMISPGFVQTPATAQNDFEMPALMDTKTAAQAIIKGLQAGEFDIHFPKHFTLVLKLLRLLPYAWYFSLLRRFVKI